MLESYEAGAVSLRSSNREHHATLPEHQQYQQHAAGAASLRFGHREHLQACQVVSTLWSQSIRM